MEFIEYLAQSEILIESNYNKELSEIEKLIKKAKQLLQEPMKHSEELDGIFYNMEKLSSKLQDILHKEIE